MCRVSSRLNNKRAFARVRNVLQTCVLTRLPVKWRRKFRIDVRDGPWVVPTVGVTFTGRRQRKPHISVRSRVRARNGLAWTLRRNDGLCRTEIKRYLGCSELSVLKMHSPCVSKFQNTLVLCAVPRELSLVKNLQQCIYAHYCLLNVCTVQVTSRPLLRRVVFCKQNSLLTTHKRLLKHHKCKQIKTSVLCTAWSATSSCKKFACYHKLRKLCGPSN